jgi:hypothetical protein
MLSFLQKYFFELSTVIKNDTIRVCSAQKVGHHITSCYQTNILFQNILTCDEDEDDSLSDLIITQIVLKGGQYFPDHQLIYIQYKDRLYIIQSFYYVYTFKGKYGLQMIKDKGEINDFLSIIESYEKLSSSLKPDPEKIKSINQRFMKYTGVDMTKHDTYMLAHRNDDLPFFWKRETTCSLESVQRHIIYIVNDLLGICDSGVDRSIRINIETFLYGNSLSDFSKENSSELTGFPVEFLDDCKSSTVRVNGVLTFTYKDLCEMIKEFLGLIGVKDIKINKSKNINRLYGNTFTDYYIMQSWDKFTKTFLHFKKKSTKKKSIKKKSTKKKSTKKKSTKKKSTNKK